MQWSIIDFGSTWVNLIFIIFCIIAADSAWNMNIFLVKTISITKLMRVVYLIYQKTTSFHFICIIIYLVLVLKMELTSKWGHAIIWPISISNYVCL